MKLVFSICCNHYLEYLGILKSENCKQIPTSFELYGLLDTHDEDYISKKITAVNQIG